MWEKAEPSSQWINFTLETQCEETSVGFKMKEVSKERLLKALKSCFSVCFTSQLLQKFLNSMSLLLDKDNQSLFLHVKKKES